MERNCIVNKIAKCHCGKRSKAKAKGQKNIVNDLDIYSYNQQLYIDTHIFTLKLNKTGYISKQ